MDAHALRHHVYFIDYLKVLAILGVFYYHSAMIFATAPWVISNRERSLGLSAVALLGYLFGMPLLFFLSGAAVKFTLDSRSVTQFVKLRFARLVIPLAAGIVLLSPIQAYYALLNAHAVNTPLPQFALHFYSGLRFAWDPRLIGAYGYHLWFLGFLFLYSLLGVPLFALLKTDAGVRFVRRIAELVDTRPGLILFGLPSGLVAIALRAPFHDYQDWSDFFAWFVYFILGYMFMTDRHFIHAFTKQGRLALMVGLVSGLLLAFLAVTGHVFYWEGHPQYTFDYLAYQAMRSLYTWCCVVLVIYVGIRFMNRTNRVVRYLSEGIMPFYVLHHPVIVVIGYYVIQTTANLWIKHVVITATALVTTLALYELLIRRFRLSRWLFGMRRRVATRGRPAAGTPAVDLQPGAI